ncbi:MAG: hypothetical protein ABI355_05435 [Solirubrobacteraceae bacterium]
MTIVLAAGVAIAVAVATLMFLGHTPAALEQPAATPAGASALVARLGILRRPQIPADLALSAGGALNGLPDYRQIVPSLTRLAVTVATPSGPVRVYVVVRRPGGTNRYRRALARTGYQAWAVTVRGSGSNATQGLDLTAQGLDRPDVIAFGNGVDQSLIPDGITRVRWVFSGRSASGQQLRGPVTLSPTIRNNVAAAPAIPHQGILSSALWYDANGRVVASWRTQLLPGSTPIAAIPADLTRAFAALRRPRTLADRLPTDAGNGIAGYGGVNPTFSRLVLATMTLRLWLVPGAQQSCLVLATPGASEPFGCSTNAIAETAGLIRGLTKRNSPSAGQRWFGVLPNGTRNARAVSTNGTSVQVPINHDGGFLQPVKRPSSFSYTQPDGTDVNLPATTSTQRAGG